MHENEAAQKIEGNCIEREWILEDKKQFFNDFSLDKSESLT